MWALLRWTSLPYRIEKRRRPQEYLSLGHCRRAERVVAEVVLGQQHELGAGLDDARHAVFVSDVDLSVGQHGGAAVCRIAQTLRTIDRLARLGLEDVHDAAVVDRIQIGPVADRRRHIGSLVE